MKAPSHLFHHLSWYVLTFANQGIYWNRKLKWETTGGLGDSRSLFKAPFSVLHSRFQMSFIRNSPFLLLSGKNSVLSIFWGFASEWRAFEVLGNLVSKQNFWGTRRTVGHIGSIQYLLRLLANWTESDFAVHEPNFTHTGLIGYNFAKFANSTRTPTRGRWAGGVKRSSHNFQNV